MALIKDENISKAQNYFLGYQDAKKDMQEKVNKALDEIENLEKIELSFSDLEGNVGSSWFVCFDEVLEILKRNLECDKDA